MSTVVSYVTIPVNEKTTSEYTAILVGEDGVAIGSGSVTTMILTLTDEVTGVVINSRSAQDIFNINGGSLDSAGNFVMIFSQSDSPILDDTLEVERHLALFQWTYGSGKGGKRCIAIPVNNLGGVT